MEVSLNLWHFFKQFYEELQVQKVLEKFWKLKKKVIAASRELSDYLLVAPLDDIEQYTVTVYKVLLGK